MSKPPKSPAKTALRSERRSSDIQFALLPDIAIARVGGATEPMACYDWSEEPDNSPGGSGKTTIESRPSLCISKDGQIQCQQPAAIPPIQLVPGRLIALREPKRSQVEFTQPVENGRSQLFRPVCPWFVLFARRRGGDWKMLLPQDLEGIGVAKTGISWHVLVANRKAYNMTLALEDIVYSEAKVGGDQKDGYGESETGLIEQPLVGRSDADYWINRSGFPYKAVEFDDSKRLIPKNERRFDLGCIKAPLFSDVHGIRLRFQPPKGAVYGPTNLQQHIKDLLDKLTPKQRADLFENWDDWRKLEIQLIPELRRRYCILNPKSAWVHKVVQPKQEIRTLPGPQFAHVQVPMTADDLTYYSLGLIDDFSDGIVTVNVATKNGEIHAAQARIVVGPPDLAPDRRHPVRLYEAFVDRVYLGGGESGDQPPEELSEEGLSKEVLDLFRRAYETVGLTNVDAMNHRLGNPFSGEMKNTAPGNLPLTQLGRDKHRRLASQEALEDNLRERPKRKDMRQIYTEPGPENDRHGLINLPPGDSGEVPKANAFNRMPALLRGPQFDPLHLTKRQITVLRHWLDTLKRRRS
jgi:hypothetical protein